MGILNLLSRTTIYLKSTFLVAIIILVVFIAEYQPQFNTPKVIFQKVETTKVVLLSPETPKTPKITSTTTNEPAILKPSTEKITDTDNHFESKIMREKYNISCKHLFEDSKDELKRATNLLNTLRNNKTYGIKLLPDSNYIFNQSMCNKFRSIRGYDRHNVTDFERSFPIAYVILVDNGMEVLERLLSVIYRPHNIYCIHVDVKSSEEFKLAAWSIFGCFDNIFSPTKTESVRWGEFSLLKAQLNCMNDLLHMAELMKKKKLHPNLLGKKSVEWKYLMNVASTFLPLRTNLELTRILNMYSGSSDIEIILDNRFDFRWKSAWKYDESKKEMLNMGMKKSDPPFGFRVAKGSNYLAASRLFVDSVIHSDFGLELGVWAQDMCDKTEYTLLVNFKRLWATLAYNVRELGFTANKRKKNPTFTNFCRWHNLQYNESCYSAWRHGICIMSIYDLPLLTRRPEYFANKFMISHDPIAYQCMEEWYDKRVSLSGELPFDLNIYCEFMKERSNWVSCGDRPSFKQPFFSNSE